MSQTLRNILGKTLLTGRGYLLVILGGLSLKWVAIPEGDLVLSVLSGGAVALPILSAIPTFFLRRALKERIILETGFDHENAVSGRPVTAALTLRNSSLPPLFQLRLKRCFEYVGAESPEHLVTGADEHGRYLMDTVSFPHRGVWLLQAVNFEVADRFGLAQSSFSIPAKCEVEVFAPRLNIRPLPIVSSSARSGDTLEHLNERTGDPFDMKAYDPSDGIARVLWKTYARTGELVVRRQEPAVVPEGEVAIYLVAEKKEDHVVGGLSSYLEQLDRNNIAVLFSTDGARGKVFQRHSEIFRAIHVGVWSPNCGTGDEFPLFLNSLSGELLTQVVVFCSEEFITRSEGIQAECGRRKLGLKLAVVPRLLGSGAAFVARHGECEIIPCEVFA
jgi:hypothetical protein